MKNDQIEKSYDYISAIFQRQAPRIPSFNEVYGDGTIHGKQKMLAKAVYLEILNSLEGEDTAK